MRLLAFRKRLGEKYSQKGEEYHVYGGLDYKK